LNAEVIIDFLVTHKQELFQRFTVKKIGLFGSYRRNTATRRSDIDILAELEQPTFDHYMDLKFYLEEHLGRPVDLVMADSIKPRIISRINEEVVYA
jgi:hypothetical protein